VDLALNLYSPDGVEINEFKHSVTRLDSYPSRLLLRSLCSMD
jgi:hypothetical protein